MRVVISLFIFVWAVYQPVFAIENGHIRKYYYYVNTAHVKICQLNNDLANIYFDSAFALREYPFFIDLNNAVYTQVNSTTPNQFKIDEYFKLIQNKGICVHQKYKSIENYQPYLSRVEHSKCHLSDSSVLVEIKKIVAADQVLRVFSIEELEKHYHPKILPALNLLDSINYLDVEEILGKDYNFPLEEELGYDEVNNLLIVYLHNKLWGRENFKRKVDLVLNGDLDNRQVSSFLDEISFSEKYSDSIKKRWHPLYMYYGTHLTRYIDGEIFIPEVESQYIDILQQYRHNIMLQDIYEEAKIKAFVILNIEKGLRYPGIRVTNGYDFTVLFAGWKYVKYTNLQDYDWGKEFIKN